jgi:hypothetical protein
MDRRSFMSLLGTGAAAVSGASLLAACGGSSSTSSSAAPALSAESMLVRSSHERWDGAGYPDGLMGPEIPLGSRIILACDAFEAMTSPRSYQTIRSAGEALAELSRCAGSHFDPEVVAALAEALPVLLPAFTADHTASDALARARGRFWLDTLAAEAALRRVMMRETRWTARERR